MLGLNKDRVLKKNKNNVLIVRNIISLEFISIKETPIKYALWEFNKLLYYS